MSSSILTTTPVQLIAEDLDNGRTETSDIIVGLAMMILSLICAIAYSVILTSIWRDSDLIRMTSYKFMFALGIFDVVQCLPHFVTGLFTIYQTTWFPWLAKLMGVLATPCYVAYAVMTIILSFNRFIQLLSPSLDRILFSKAGVICWIGFAMLFWLFFVIALGSPWASIIYFPDWYSWDYDHTMSYSWLVQRIEMFIEIGGIFVSTFFYILVVILLFRTRRRFRASTSYYVEVKILIQASVITVYCTILNVYWHNYEVLLPASIWSYMGLNFMWILNSGIYPIIYAIVNRAIRQKISSKKSNFMSTVSAFHRPGKSTSFEPSTVNTTIKRIQKQFSAGRAIAMAIEKSPKLTEVV